MVKQDKTLTQEPTWLVQFGHRLERARGQMGLTQTNLAASDLSKSFVSLLETARSYPSVETLLLLAKRSGTSVGGLLLESGELRTDAALSILAVARESIYRRPAWARAVLESARELLPDLPPWARSDLALLRGLSWDAEGRLKAAEASAKEALRIAEEAGFDPGRARARALLGHVTLMRRDLPKTLNILATALEEFRASRSLRSEFGIRTLLWTGTAAIQAGRMRYARGLYEKARRLATRLRLPVLEGQALWGLGHYAWVEGDLARAAQLMREARKAFEETEDLLDLAEVMRNLGVVLTEQGKMREAGEALDHATRLADRVGNLRMRSAAYGELARLRLQLHELEGAERSARHAAALARSAGDHLFIARAVATQGRIAAARGNRAKAGRLLREAGRAMKRLGAKGAAAEVARDLALVRASGPGSEAEHYLTQAIGSSPRRSTGRRKRPLRSARSPRRRPT